MDGALKAVNLGDDTDTTGAVYGQIAGAFYGINSIPSEWKNKIYYKDKWILPLADRLFELSGL
jgi:ADP-ribosyl-[dinitrogen reductase] hydrolase